MIKSVHPKYRKRTDYCCCTGTVHCNYCIGQGKPPHLTVDKDFNQILITDKEQINELEQNMNDTKINDQTLAINAIKANAFIIGSVDSQGYLSFAATPTTHATAASARTECRRLAKTYPGKLYIFVQLTGAEMVPTNTISI